MQRFSLSLLLFACVLTVAVGCGPASPRQKLSGRWKGAPDVTGEVDKYVELVKEKGGDEEEQEVTRNIAEFTGKFASRMALGVELDLNDGGDAQLRGETRVFALNMQQKGTWEVVSDRNPIILRIKFGDKQFDGKVTFRDEDAFFFQFDAPVDAITSLTGEAPPDDEDAKTKPATLLFRRRKYS